LSTQGTSLTNVMTKLIAALNMTLDGYCDHTVGIVDDEIHNHYAELLKSAGAILYGRKTFQLMEYWRPFAEKPTGNKSNDDFAVTIDKIPKIVYSRTLKSVDWKTATLKKEINKDEILKLRQQSSRDILVGSPSLIVGLTNIGIVDEYQIAVHPIIIGTGLPLFKNISERVDLKLLKTKTARCGVVFHYYERVGQNTPHIA
jgi:dihydrofolate reductase